MIRRMLVVSLISFVFFPLVVNADHHIQNDSLDKAIDKLNERIKVPSGLTLDTKPISESIKTFKKLVKKPKYEKKGSVYLLKAYYFKGTYTDISSSKKQKIFQKGKDFGEKMMEKYPDYGPVHYGYAANLGRWSEVNGIVASAREGVAGQLRDVAKEVAELSPELKGGGGYRLQSIVHIRAPYIPFVVPWPSTKKAMKKIKKALEIAPNHPGNVFQLGEVHYDKGNIKEAKKKYKKVLNMDPRENNLLEDRRIQKKARKKLNKI